MARHPNALAPAIGIFNGLRFVAAIYLAAFLVFILFVAGLSIGERQIALTTKRNQETSAPLSVRTASSVQREAGR